MDWALEMLCECPGMSAGTGARDRRVGRRRGTSQFFDVGQKNAMLVFETWPGP